MERGLKKMKRVRTLEEFGKEMEKAHDCDKCRGRIFVIVIYDFGNKYCSYCSKKVDYPNPTKEELELWLKNKGIDLSSNFRSLS